MIPYLQVIAVKLYSTRNEGKSVFSERFIRTLKNEIDKHMALKMCLLIN